MKSLLARRTPATIPSRRFAYLISLLLLVPALLASCLSPVTPVSNPTPADQATPTPEPIPYAMVTFQVEVPAPLDPGENLSLDILDEVTGLAFNKTSIAMDKVDDLHYTKTTPFQVGSVVKYRYSDGPVVQENTTAGIDVRYRLVLVNGPTEVHDIVSRWTGKAAHGSYGRLSGQVIDAQTGAPIPNIFIAVGGQQTLTASDGTYLIEGLPVGIHNLVAYSLDGHYQSYQQGAQIAANATTPASLKLTPAKFVKIVFTVKPPEGTIPGVPVHLVGNLYQLGNTFANLAGGVSVLAERSPTMTILPDGQYTLTLDLPVGADVRYKYSLGDGLWNAEHASNGSFRLRELIVPDTTEQIEDQIDSWGAGNSAPITFDTTVPGNTPAGENVSISFNPGFGWTESIPMWSLGNQHWIYVLYSPLDAMKALSFRYCRNNQCGVTGDIKTSSGSSGGQTVNTSLVAETIDDPVTQWTWLTPNQEPATVPNLVVEKRAGEFLAGVEFQPAYHPSWQPYLESAFQDVHSLNANWVLLDPTWSFNQENPPVLEPVPGKDMLWPDVVSAISEAHARSLKVALFPTPSFPGGTDTWWQNGQRDFAWWQVWFEQYRTFLLNYADLASSQGVDTLILGGDTWLSSALPGGLLSNGSTSAVPLDAVERWTNLIKDVRSHYHGIILWALPYPQGVQNTPAFLDQVDGIYLLWSVALSGQPNATEDDMAMTTGQILDDVIKPWQTQLNKPLVLGMGYASATGSSTGCIASEPDQCVDANTLSQPQADNTHISLNLDEQTRAYNAMLLAVNQRAWIAGVTSRGYYPPAVLEDKSLSIHGKPARGVLWFWFGKWLGKE